MPGKVWLVGAGPGDPGLLTLKGARALAQCDVLVYDYLASAAIVALAPPDCEKIYVGKKAGQHALSQDEITALIVRLGREGKRVVRLKGGDVFVFARGGEEAQALARSRRPVRDRPRHHVGDRGARVRRHPRDAPRPQHAFTVATGHEDPAKGFSSLDFAKLANRKATTIFLMAMGNLAGIVGKLREHGLEGDTPVGIVHEGTKPAQEVVTATLDTIVAEVERTGITAPAVVVVGDVVRERERIRWFDAQPLFGKRVLITRPAHQADDLATRLWEAGAEPIVAPAIAIGPPDDLVAARDAVARVRDYAWIVFTSRNGVDAFFDRARRARTRRARARRREDRRDRAQDRRGARRARHPRRPRAGGVRQRSRRRRRCSRARRPATVSWSIARRRRARCCPRRCARRDAASTSSPAYATRSVDDPELRGEGRARRHRDVHQLEHGARLRPQRARRGTRCSPARRSPRSARSPRRRARDAGIRVDVVADEFTVDGLLRALAARRGVAASP